LVGQQVGVDEDPLLLRGRHHLPQNVVLTLATDPAALVGSAQVEDSLSHEELFGQGVIDPTLSQGRGTYISLALMVLSGEWMRESFSNLKVVVTGPSLQVQVK
jgi:hypothetical protein